MCTDLEGSWNAGCQTSLAPAWSPLGPPSSRHSSTTWNCLLPTRGFEFRWIFVCAFRRFFQSPPLRHWGWECSSRCSAGCTARHTSLLAGHDTLHSIPFPEGPSAQRGTSESSQTQNLFSHMLLFPWAGWGRRHTADLSHRHRWHIWGFGFTDHQRATTTAGWAQGSCWHRVCSTLQGLFKAAQSSAPGIAGRDTKYHLYHGFQHTWKLLPPKHLQPPTDKTHHLHPLCSLLA